MYLRSLLSLLFVLAMPGIGDAQSYRVATVRTSAFVNPQSGITRLINAGRTCRAADPDRQRQCVSRASLSITREIAKDLDEYASRNHLILFDADSHFEEYCIIEGDVPDITKEFIDYYNRAHSAGAIEQIVGRERRGRVC